MTGEGSSEASEKSQMAASEKSITGWFHALRDGDDSAAEDLWNRYFARLTGLAKSQLVHDPAYNEEDLAVSVFDALCRATRGGSYQSLGDREELWRLLVTIANRKMIDRHRRTTAKRRALTDEDVSQLKVVEDLDELAGSECSPEWQLVLAERCQILLDLLDDDRMREIALLKLDQHTNHEIADQLHISERSVRRTINLIRRTWQQELQQEDE